MNKTYDFSRAEVGTTPSRGVCCAAVEAPSADTICKLRVGVGCVHDRGRWLSRNRVMVTVICCARRMNRRGLWRRRMGHGSGNVMGRKT